MRYSANLNVIVKAIEKATAHISRDFIELENLQTNPNSANKFANACYNRVKQVLVDEFTKIRPDYNLFFSDGQSIVKSKSAEYSYVIFPIDGLHNLTRSNPDFTVAVALEHANAAGQKEPISVAISKIFGSELYYCEKGFGAYLNNRRIRVSKRHNNEPILIGAEDQSLLDSDFVQKNNLKTFSTRTYGCRSLEVAYVASARLEMAAFKNQEAELLKPFLLLVREAGGKVLEDAKLILASN